MIKLDYPVIRYDNSYIRGDIKSKRDLCRSLESFVDADRFENSIIVDSSGQQFRITSVKKKGKVFAPWYHAFNDDKFLKLDFELEPLGKIGLEELKRVLIDLFETHPKWMPKYIRTEVVSFHTQARTIKEIIKLGMFEGDNMGD